MEKKPPLAVSWRAIAITAVVLVAAWGFDVFVLRTTHLTGGREHPPLTPLYAFFEPAWHSGALVYVAAAGLFAWFGPRLADPERVGRGRFAAVLFACACVLPIALFLVRQSAEDFRDPSRLFGHSDFFQDAARVQDVGSFLRGYVAMMPSLSLHGQHFPPGPAIFVHVSQEVFGEAPVVHPITVLVAFAAGVVAAYGAMREIAGERAARAGALMLLAAPSVLDHACTSMDAVFMACASGVWWCAVRAFRPGARVGFAVLLGVVLLVATCVSFSTIPVGLAIAIFALAKWRTSLRRLIVVGAVYAACAWVLDRSTGFSILECFRAAQEHAKGLMGPLIASTARATWPYRTYGNAVAFLIGAGVALVTGVAVRVGGRPVALDRWSVAVGITLAVMAGAPIYYMETERIWVFAMPWLAAVAVGGGSGVEDASLRRLLVAGAVQSVLMEGLLFTFW